MDAINFAFSDDLMLARGRLQNGLMLLSKLDERMQEQHDMIKQLKTDFLDAIDDASKFSVINEKLQAFSQFSATVAGVSVPGLAGTDAAAAGTSATGTSAAVAAAAAATTAAIVAAAGPGREDRRGSLATTAAVLKHLVTSIAANKEALTPVEAASLAKDVLAARPARPGATPAKRRLATPMRGGTNKRGRGTGRAGRAAARGSLQQARPNVPLKPKTDDAPPLDKTDILRFRRCFVATGRGANRQVQLTIHFDMDTYWVYLEDGSTTSLARMATPFGKNWKPITYLAGVDEEEGNAALDNANLLEKLLAAGKHLEANSSSDGKSESGDESYQAESQGEGEDSE